MFHLEQFADDCFGKGTNVESCPRNRRDNWETTRCASVMFWGCISYHGVGTLTPVEGNMNTEKYISVLDDNLWPVIARHFSNRLDFSGE
jgi:hypothetical protein